VYSSSSMGSYSLVPTPDSSLSDMPYIQGTATAGARRTAGAGSVAGGGQRMIGTNTAAPGTAGGGGGEGAGGGLTVQGLPIAKPPYGQISAINLDRGDITWQVPHGETPDAVKNSPALNGLTIPRTGRNGIIGVLVTKALIVAGDSGIATQPSGARGAMLRAYDKGTGKEVGAIFMPAQQSGSPMTYLLNGKQYMVLAIGGGNYSGELLAFRLPG
jgi:quinoprotein glucose dehydrogenase